MLMKNRDRIAVSMGDCNSISPEITIKSLNYFKNDEVDFILFTSKSVLAFCEKNLGLVLENKNVEIAGIDFEPVIEEGEETKSAGEFAYRSLVSAIQYCKKNGVSKLVTAPVSKNALYLAGHKYNGQTEILQEFVGAEDKKAQMLFVAGDYRVLLLTRHLALKDVSGVLKKKFIVDTIAQAKKSFVNQLGVDCPKFALCSLNPHCGENGIMGGEEINELIPAMDELKNQLIDVDGLYPADSLFSNATASFLNNEPQKFDCYIACYHDQGLIPIKAVAKNRAINVTIGLDILRASPAHGTAFDITGKNIANCESMIEAINFFLK